MKKLFTSLLIAALILCLTIGIEYSAAGAITFTAGATTISLSGLAIASIVGIVLKGEFTPGSEARVLNLNAEEPYSITAVAAYRTDPGKKRLFLRFPHPHTVREGECACLTVPETDLCAGDILGNRSASDT